MEKEVLGAVPEVEGIGRILYLGEGEDGRRYLSIEFKDRGKEDLIKKIYHLQKSGIGFEKCSMESRGNIYAIFSVRRLNPWEL